MDPKERPSASDLLRNDPWLNAFDTPENDLSGSAALLSSLHNEEEEEEEEYDNDDDGDDDYYPFADDDDDDNNNKGVGKSESISSSQ